ncbi:MAG: hypothetical protein QOD84_780 [Acidobacteriaceae bacterium]|jgi:hypothetical protein
MRHPSRILRKQSQLAALAVLFLATSACSINVKKNGEGEEKKVDIETPVGGIHVGQDVNVHDTGLPLYPGARPKVKGEGGDEDRANLNISTGMFGVKIVAIEFHSDDPPAKVVSYYQDQLKKFGKVVECHSDKKDDDGGDVQINANKDSHHSKEVTCEGKNQGSNIELKVGTDDNQHVVSIKPKEQGSDFGLVYIRTRGEKGSI